MGGGGHPVPEGRAVGVPSQCPGFLDPQARGGEGRGGRGGGLRETQTPLVLLGAQDGHSPGETLE